MGQAQRDELRVAGRVWLEVGERPYLGRGRIELLERIAETGSISAAARAMGMSYKAAWDAVDAVNNLSATPLVVQTTGGHHGGGTVLTEEGRRVVDAFRAMETEYGRFLEELRASWVILTSAEGAPRTSARNRLCGKVSRCVEGAVNSEVVLELPGGKTVTAIVTNESVRELGLAVGVSACALVKASHVILAVED